MSTDPRDAGRARSADAESDELERLERALGHCFRDRALLENALHHASYAHEHPESSSNERLEFLGDSVVGLVVAEAFYRAKPDWSEGDLTRALHSLVEGRALAKLARRIELGGLLRLGRTELRSGGREKDSILADAMEAVIGALYLDGGVEVVRAFVDRVFEEALHADAPAVSRDPKTELQERTMAARGAFPAYRLLRDSEIEGDEDRFSIEVRLGDESLASGIGRTKRAAERRAAERALESWRDEPADAIEASNPGPER